MVASTHWRATAAFIAELEHGANAVEAAVAAGSPGTSSSGT
jgi:gamma-glutamyltranspeptidase